MERKISKNYYVSNFIFINSISVLFQEQICEILERIIGSCVIGIRQIEEASGNLVQPQIFGDAGGAAFIVLGGVYGTFEVFACAERA